MIVVGAGVSGCACAAALAAAGLPVLLVNSALDVVGLPGYGPSVAGPWDRWVAGEATVLDEVEPRLLQAWTRWASMPEALMPDSDGRRLGGGRPAGRAAPGEAGEADDPASPFVVVDRRAVSLECKQMLESLPGIRMRQGLVVAVRASSAPSDADSDVRADQGSGGEPIVPPGGPPTGSVEVLTAFGEVFKGVACVLAVGLGLGGRVIVGDQVLEGARYGEVAADGLLEDLGRAGVRTREGGAQVGAWVLSSDGLLAKGRWCSLHGRWVPLRPLVSPSPPADEHARGPHHPPLGQETGPDTDAWDPSPRGCILMACADGSVTGVFPDGVATGEWYVAPAASVALTSARAAAIGGPALVLDTARSEGTDEVRVSRPPHSVHGRRIEGAEADGRIPELDRVWAAGQVVGARGYVESLVSGSRTAAAIERWFRAVYGSSDATAGDPSRDPARG